MSKDVKNVPALRFKGFSDAWEKRKFKDIVTRVNQMSNDSKLPSVEFEDIVSGQGRLRKSAHLKFNTKKGISFQPRDVLFGKLRPYLHNWLFPNFHGRAVGDFWVLRANSNVFPGYLFQLVQAPRFQSIANISSGTKMPRSDWKTVAESHFLLPDVSEQKRIWQLFKVLDDLIAATQQKLDNLRQVKKSMSQHLLGKSIRFREFSATWEKRKLGDLLKERNVQHPQSSEYPLVSFTVENGVTPKTERYEREQLVRGDKQAKRYKETRLDDIVYNPANLKFGAIARNSFGKAVFSPIYVTFEVNQELALAKYVELLVTQNSFLSRALRYQQGTVYERQSVSPRDLLNLSVALPDKEEQMNISLVFSRLDKLIMTTQSQLSTFKILKKSLLQNLFV